jgi:hypothetical protein
LLALTELPGEAVVDVPNASVVYARRIDAALLRLTLARQLPLRHNAIDGEEGELHRNEEGAAAGERDLFVDVDAYGIVLEWMSRSSLIE